MKDRKQRWREKVQFIKMKKLFPPRIQLDLQKHDFKVDLEHEQPNLYLFGGVGSGKSLYAAKLTLEDSKTYYLNNMEDITRLFISVPRLFFDIKSTFNSPPRRNDSMSEEDLPLTEQDLVRQYCEVDWLVLDDMGAEKGSEWALQTLYVIINHRYEHLKTTIFTSNYSLNRLAEKLGDDRIPSRIAGMSVQVNFGEKDLRLEK